MLTGAVIAIRRLCPRVYTIGAWGWTPWRWWPRVKPLGDGHIYVHWGRRILVVAQRGRR